MSEKHTIISGDSVNYSGIFQLSELFSLMNSYLREVGYDKRVCTNNQETVDDLKIVTLSLKPYKVITDYVKFEIEISVDASVLDVEVTLNNQKQIVQKGNLGISFNAYVETDYAGQWESKSEYFFLRTVFNKFLYKNKFTEWDSQLKSQVQHLKAEISSFLNMKRFHDYETHTKRDTLR